MKKQIEFMAGYHEWNLFINGEVAMTFSSGTIDDIVYNAEERRPATIEEIKGTITCYIEDTENKTITKLADKDKEDIINLITNSLFTWYCD